ncbi:enolase [Stenotrophomonas sp. S41]|uniref:enolase n=1 Tax=Stenotrophomonas sp. S41 TaxID=2767464 RepID=UPI001909EC1C|nr:enolase [Stenotrophomonas sp. S41]MBK0013785.1 enolase [Stenotrophomonas sp. S41]
MLDPTELRDLLPGMEPFPADVFPADQAWLGQHLLPLLNIDLGVLRPELAGQVATMLCPIEPYEGCIGDDTTAHHNAFTGINWIAFELTADNRMRFLGTQEYFLGEAVDGDEARAHIVEMRESHAKARAYFQQHGRLASCSRYGDGELDEQAWLQQLGGPIWFGNWSDYAPLPAAFQLQDLAGYRQRGSLRLRNDSSQLADDGLQLTRDGQAFFHVASVPASNWVAAGADAIVMFYEPHSRTVLFTFDWS